MPEPFTIIVILYKLLWLTSYHISDIITITKYHRAWTAASIIAESYSKLKLHICFGVLLLMITDNPSTYAWLIVVHCPNSEKASGVPPYPLAMPQTLE